MSDYNDGYAEGRATYIDKLDEMTMQQEVDRKRIAELERDGMEPRAVLRSRIAELEAERDLLKRLLRPFGTAQQWSSFVRGLFMGDSGEIIEACKYFGEDKRLPAFGSNADLRGGEDEARETSVE
jgi:hypothetical protein